MREANLDELAIWLGEHELFHLLGEEGRRALLAKATRVSFAANEVLFQQGDDGAYCLLILSGRVRIYLVSEEGKEILVSLMESGALLGEMALLDGRTRSASAIAGAACACLRFDRSDFLDILKDNPPVIMELVRLLCLRLRQTTTRLEQIALQDVPARLARFLLDLAAAQGEPSPSGIRIASQLRQSDLAGCLAASRESINKVLNIWQAHDLIALLPRHEIILKNVQQLQKLAGCRPTGEQI